MRENRSGNKMTMCSLQSKIRNPQSAIPRRGFSFVEVLFAVMILGVGFIMIAGVFPVAISQTQTSGEETVGSAVGRSGAGYMASIPFSSLVPPNPWVGDPAFQVK